MGCFNSSDDDEVPTSPSTDIVKDDNRNTQEVSFVGLALPVVVLPSSRPHTNDEAIDKASAADESTQNEAPAKGEETTVTDLWRHRRLILTWLRHFGCRFCKKQAVEMEAVRTKLLAYGCNDVDVVVVAIGTPEQICKFRTETGFLGEIWVDRDPNIPLSYRLMNLKKGSMEEVIKPALAAGEKVLRQGYVDGGYPSASPNPITNTTDYTGDILQVGGVFVLGVGNVCDYAYRSSHAGDHPDTANSLEIIEIATGRKLDKDGNLSDDYIYKSSAKWSEQLKLTTSKSLLQDTISSVKSPESRRRRETDSFFQRQRNEELSRYRSIALIMFTAAAICFAVAARLMPRIY